MDNSMKIIVTGGAGFIGSALIRQLIKHTEHSVLNIDKLTYAANMKSLQSVLDHERYQFAQADICDKSAMQTLIQSYQPDIIFHLAAESHVDRSIHDPDIFVQANVLGTQILLDTANEYWQDKNQPKGFRFIYISTDEVYGSRSDASSSVGEDASYQPNSPYAGSKAAATHMAKVYHKTYELPVIVTHSSNNYGPWQNPEKLIPKTITRALRGESIPIYGQGTNQRDWLFVEDHVLALYEVMQKGVIGESYNVASGRELSNLELVKMLCQQLDQQRPVVEQNYESLIQFVDDRPGHDLRYGVSNKKITNQLKWRPSVALAQGLEATVRWHLENIAS